MPESLPELPAVIGWDIGGAHLKAARLDGGGRLESVLQLPCPLWQGMEHLGSACNAALASMPVSRVPTLHAVTMSGEMADLFPDRASGVVAIVAFLKDLLAQHRRGDELHVFAGAAGFVAADAVRAGSDGNTDLIASANWLATAQHCASRVGSGILIDIGSTTADLIPFAESSVCDVGGDDRARLARGELVYAGIVRTPLMALARQAPFAGGWRATISELFATTADVFRILGELDEDLDLQPAADGGAKTPEASARRLLRMVGEDLPGTDANAVRGLAQWYRERLLDRIVEGLGLRLSRCDLGPAAAMIGAGIGRFLLPDLAARMRRPYREIDGLLCAEDSDIPLRSRAGHCAPAVAVARLLQARRT
jgi:probable H4MPT-linked C1 transfer pathway protein